MVANGKLNSVSPKQYANIKLPLSDEHTIHHFFEWQGISFVNPNGEIERVISQYTN